MKLLRSGLNLSSICLELTKNAKNTIKEKAISDEIPDVSASTFDRYFGNCSRYLNTILPIELKIDDENTRDFSKVGYELMQKISSLIYAQKYYDKPKEELAKSDYVIQSEGLGHHRGKFFNVKFIVQNDTVLYTELVKK